MITISTFDPIPQCSKGKCCKLVSWLTEKELHINGSVIRIEYWISSGVWRWSWKLIVNAAAAHRHAGERRYALNYIKDGCRCDGGVKDHAGSINNSGTRWWMPLEKLGRVLAEFTWTTLDNHRATYAPFQWSPAVRLNIFTRGRTAT